MSQVTIDSTDNPDVQASQQEAEAKSLAIGEKIINEHQEAETAVYEKARQDAESQIRYANKFRSAEDLEKAYLELEKKLGQPKTEASENEDQDEQPDESAEVREEEGQQGDQQEETAPPEQPNLTSEEEKEILDSVGGADFYNQAVAWAATNLSPEESAAYDAILAAGDKNVVQFAVSSLVQRFKSQGEFDGAPVSGKAVRGQGVKPFRSQAELARAIGNSKYQTDPAYRIDVEQRLAASGDLL
jgi:hypothetical protein